MGSCTCLSTGCQWRAIPKDLPPRSTVFAYLDLWCYDGTLERIHYELYVRCREKAEREASPTAAIIDSQSVKSAEKGGASIDPNGYDAGKKIKGKKRHILVDTLGLLLHAIVHPADIQDRDGGILLLSTLFGLFPFLEKALCRRRLSRTAISGSPRQSARLSSTSKSSSAPIRPKAFEVLPKRWIVERTFAWLSRCRRLAKDFENLTRTALTFVKLASIRIMLRRLCNPS